MLQAAESLVPILLLVILGAGLSRFDFFSSEMRDGLDRFVYWIALPALFIHDLAETDFGELEAGLMVVVLGGGTVAASLLAAIFAWVLRLSADEFGVFVQVAFRGNMAFVGLPVIIFAVGGPAGQPGLVASGLVALAAMVPVTNIIAVLALLLAKQDLSMKFARNVGFGLITNPLILSALAGAGLGWLGWALPEMVGRSFDLLGQTALALALVSLGGALVDLKVAGRIGLSFVAAIFKVTVVPAVTFGLAVALGLGAAQTLVVMIFAACPSATASYILTTQLGGDEALAAASIVVSTFLAFGSLAVVLVVF